jgi:hypothetical protein
MLKYCESFDHLAVTPAGNVAWGASCPLSLLGWTAIDSWGYATAKIEAELGRWGTNRLFLGYSSGGPQTLALSRSCNRIVVGFAFSRYSSYPYFGVTFAYGTYQNFCVIVSLSASGLTFKFRTGTGGYPAIANSAYVSVPFIQSDNYTFIEILVDVTDYVNGRVKCAVNGKVVHDVTGIKTAAGDGFGNNPYDPRAKINTIMFSQGEGYNPTQLAWMYIDSIYICDDEGGYHNDFLGDIFVKALYPTNDGDQVAWEPYLNGLPAPEGTEHVSLIDDPMFNPAIEADYIQSSQDLSQETMRFADANIPVDSTLIAVNHRIAARSVASPGTPPPNTLIPLYKSSGNDIIVTNSLAKKFTGWTYTFLDVYYNLVPGLAVDWTNLLLEGSQFGFMLREPIWTGVALEEANFADEVIDE